MQEMFVAILNLFIETIKLLIVKLTLVKFGGHEGSLIHRIIGTIILLFRT